MDNTLLKKLKMFGEDSLSTEELLAIIIGERRGRRPAIEIARELIEVNKGFTNNIRFLEELTIEDITKVKDLDENAAARLKAVCSINKHFGKQIDVAKIQILSAKDVASLFMDELRYEKEEVVKLLIMDSKNIVKKIVTLSKGVTDKAQLIVKDVLSEAIKLRAPKIILVHNHPSGDCTPSPKDRETTTIIAECAKFMGIELLDHIVVGDGTYDSALN